jgi:uncharacterized RDD family membrane protein YckC
VGNYRKRRARLQPDAVPKENLELDFDDSANVWQHRPIENELGASEDRDSGFDMEIGQASHTRSEDGLSEDELSFEPSGDDTMQLDAPPSGEEEMSLGESGEKSSPLEIVVGSPTSEEFEEEVDQGIYLAQLGRRFMAGLTDAGVLLLGVVVFALIFWRVCGSLSLVPLNLAVLGVVAVILIFAYFAVFTAVAAATPGLLWMGCEIRNLRGDHPTLSESIWRAFGVLVSLSALMLGFIWACVDSDGLTWHDRMSGTVIVEEHGAGELSSAKAET